MAAGGCSRAATECVIPAHSRATCLTDLRDHAVRLMKRRGRHCLGRRCDGQGKCRTAINLIIVFSMLSLGGEETPNSYTWLDVSQRLLRAAPGGKDRREQTHISRLDGGDYRMKIMWAAIK